MKKYLKQVDESDCKLIFEWVNDDLTRKNSFNSNDINFEEHMRWFKNKLDSESSYMYIYYIGEKPIGQVRIEIDNETGIISYNLDRNYRGKGLSLEMLKLAENESYKKNLKIKTLIGYVKLDNLASQKIFEKLKYNKLIEHNKYKYYKYI